jgi:hypothetical protein
MTQSFYYESIVVCVINCVNNFLPGICKTLTDYCDFIQ